MMVENDLVAISARQILIDLNNSLFRLCSEGRVASDCITEYVDNNSILTL
jgi:hypothetical protein